jgi:hypothetical protein
VILIVPFTAERADGGAPAAADAVPENALGGMDTSAIAAWRDTHIV